MIATVLYHKTVCENHVVRAHRWQYFRIVYGGRWWWYSNNPPIELDKDLFPLCYTYAHAHSLPSYGAMGALPNNRTRCPELLSSHVPVQHTNTCTNLKTNNTGVFSRR